MEYVEEKSQISFSRVRHIFGSQRPPLPSEYMFAVNQARLFNQFCRLKQVVGMKKYATELLATSLLLEEWRLYVF